ncbi:conserved hypothetical protein [Synechococcus sp. PCC 7335]|uniref:SH3 domain-containing protein n=1 Tax=Synechococcus sp. (strain ATCC 29403 / PCC 7335) TaxID=91464 RepID=UPI00017EDD0A|nr:SH3 domain-containing protein [Synechococcus sp. PCC 7335]EDX84086.1 conserved hypothetical protein [Synechococcus sp. PCC 7335]
MTFKQNLFANAHRLKAVSAGLLLAATTLVGSAPAASANHHLALYTPIEEPAAVDWTTRYAGEVPFSNISDGPVNVRTGPGTDRPVIRQLAHREGGIIEGCNTTLDWCLLGFGDGTNGWVKMSFFAGFADQPDWMSRYSPEAYYVNNTHGAINVRNAPFLTSTIQTTLAPNEGGYIQTCNVDLDWCQITLNGTEQTGWVYMPLMTGRVDIGCLSPSSNSLNSSNSLD